MSIKISKKTDMIEIRICDLSEFDKLKRFIHTNWKNNHILAFHDELLKWQHVNKKEGKLNYVIAFDRGKNDIVGILGFIPLSQYDPNLSNNKDFWLAIWKIQDAYKGIGIEMLHYFIELFNPNSIGSIGINDIVRKLYKVLKFKIGKVAHYYLLNPTIEEFKIAQIQEKPNRDTPITSKYKIKRIQDISGYSELKHSYCPQKSINYLIERYANHPIYHYTFYGVFMNENIQCILITRKISVNNSSCIRIIDVFGKLELDTIESELVSLLMAEKSEYIDCLNYGIEEQTFFNLGFNLRNDIIIPNYFEPFEQRNVDIQFAYMSNVGDYIIFKGDSDQDRPNII